MVTISVPIQNEYSELYLNYTYENKRFNNQSETDLEH